MKKIILVSTTADTNILVNYEKKIIISVYVNEIIYAAKKLQLFHKFEVQLKEKFKVKLFGKTRLILGILVKKNIKCKTFYLSYTYYI